MLALLITALIAFYLYGPTLVLRLAVGLVVPRKTIIQSRSEEITRSILQALPPLALAIAWAAWSGQATASGVVYDLEVVFSGLYSSVFYDLNQSQFFISLGGFLRVNAAIAWRLYLLLVILAGIQDLAIANFRRIRLFAESRLSGGAPWFRVVLAVIILPRVSEWHVLLSDMLLPEGSMLQVDVLTKTGGLYQGRVQDKSLGADGNLQSITLAGPRRYRREDYEEAKKLAAPGIVLDKKLYWSVVPGNLFVVLASDIVNLNLLYKRADPSDITPTSLSDHERALIKQLLDRMADPPADLHEDA